MMTEASRSPVTAQHRQRAAYLYIRQSTLRQVHENTESTRRQYALRERAMALGWTPDQIVVVDEDLGHSGASAAGRPGFQRLVSAVGVGQVGLILGLEVSRLARSSADWTRLVEICALTDTLICDEDGLYDPNAFNDRLLLGLKGTMSEAELHFLQVRLRGGILSKARRGELKAPLPVGFVYGPDGRVDLDPDVQVQTAVRCFFATFRRTGAATATVRAFRDQGLRFPRRVRTGPHQGELGWGLLEHSQALRILRNPRYAGTYCYGRRQCRLGVDGRIHMTWRAPADWLGYQEGAHPGYITPAEFQEHQARLQENARACGVERRSPPREGPALLQGLALCGVCGQRMTVRYHRRQSRLVPEYVCQRVGIEQARALCQRLPGRTLDAAIGQLLVDALTPVALALTLAVEAELRAQAEDVDRLHAQAVERARYEAELAQRRYVRVDPDNRLVAGVLEAEWNQRLREWEAAQATRESAQAAARVPLDPARRAEILRLAEDFPRVWRDPATPDRERKRLVRLLLEDVTLRRMATGFTCGIRFRSGATQTLDLPLVLSAPDARRTPTTVVALVDDLLNTITEAEIAQTLNARGYRTGTGQPFDRGLVRYIRSTYGLADRLSRLRAQGYLTKEEMAARLGIGRSTLLDWKRRGWVRAVPYDDKGACVYDPNGPCPPKGTWKARQSGVRPGPFQSRGTQPARGPGLSGEATGPRGGG